MAQGVKALRFGFRPVWFWGSQAATCPSENPKLQRESRSSHGVMLGSGSLWAFRGVQGLGISGGTSTSKPQTLHPKSLNPKPETLKN